jgi:HEAT repeat protein
MTHPAHDPRLPSPDGRDAAPVTGHEPLLPGAWTPEWLLSRLDELTAEAAERVDAFAYAEIIYQRLVMLRSEEWSPPEEFAKLLPMLAEALVQDDRIISRVASAALACVAPGLSAEVLAAGLAHPRADVRANSANGLAALNPCPEALAPRLLALASDADPAVRAAVVRALSRLKAEGVVEAICAATRDADRKVRVQAVYGLRDFDAGIPALIDALADRSVRFEALGTIRFHGAAAAPAIPTLIELLEAEPSFSCSHAATVLGCIGKAASGAIPALRRAAELSVDVAQRSVIRTAAVQIALHDEHPDAPKLYPELLDAVKSPAVPPPGWGELVPSLVRLLTRPDAEGRRLGALGLMWAGRVGLPAAPALADALGDPDRRVRSLAALALDRIGWNRAREAVGRAVPALAEALADEDEWFVLMASAALGRIGPAAGPAAEALGRVLESSCPLRRHTAVEALQRIGPPAAAAVPALRAAIERADPYDALRPRVEAAIRAIEGAAPRGPEGSTG